MFEIVERDGELGDGILAGALAYRLFIFMLPFVLVLIAVLGIAADAAGETPKEALDSIGLAALAVGSVAGAAESPNRWYAIVVGVPALVLATRSLLRTLIGVHRLAWAQVRASAPKPTLAATLELLGLVVAFYVLTALAAVARDRSGGLGVLATLGVALGYAALWLAISSRLPHRSASWRPLVPGALVVGFGVEVFHFVTVYVLAPYAINKQGTYGAIGAAAVLLLGFFFLSRMIVGGAMMDAALWERRTRGAGAEPGGSCRL